MGPEVMTVLSVLGGAMQYKSGRDAAAAANAETEEQLRRQAAYDKAQAAETRARIAASGITPTGSPMKYLQRLEDEQQTQQSWTARAGSARASSLKSQGMANAVSSISKIPGYWT